MKNLTAVHSPASVIEICNWTFQFLTLYIYEMCVIAEQSRNTIPWFKILP